MKYYKAKVIKINYDLGYIFLKTNTKKHEVFMPLDKEFMINNKIEIGQTVYITYCDTIRGYLANKLVFN